MMKMDKSILGLCTVRDVSVTGAQIIFNAPDKIPDEFDLLLSKRAQVRRRCRVVWRSKRAVGIRFVLV
jgi:PilZ domain